MQRLHAALHSHSRPPWLLPTLPGPAPVRPPAPRRLLPPTGCLVCSVVAVSLDPAYAEAAVLWFSSALILAVPFFVMTFNRCVADRRDCRGWTSG